MRVEEKIKDAGIKGKMCDAAEDYGEDALSRRNRNTALNPG